MRRNSVSVEDGIVPPETTKQRPEKLFLRTTSVNIQPNDGELTPTPSPGSTTKMVEDRKQNRRESIKEHLMKFKAKAGKILEDRQSGKIQVENGDTSFLSQGESDIKEELSIIDESAQSESSFQQGLSKKESKEQMRNRIRKSAQKAVERKKGNVQLNKRLARRPTVVQEEKIDENDLQAIDEQVERTIKMGEKYLIDRMKNGGGDIEVEIGNNEVEEADKEKRKKSEEVKRVKYGRVQQHGYQHDILVKSTTKDRNIICGEIMNRDTFANVKMKPKRLMYTEPLTVYYGAAVKSEDVIVRAKQRKYVKIDVFIDSIHMDYYNLWSSEELASIEVRNAFLSQMLQVHNLTQIESHHIDIEEAEKAELYKKVHEGKKDIDKKFEELQRIRTEQGYSTTQINLKPTENDEDWTKYGWVEENWKMTPSGKLPKEERERINLLRKTSIQLILYFNDIEVCKTEFVPLKSYITPFMERIEMEIHSPVQSLLFLIIERQGSKIREIGRANIPIPNEKDEQIALHEAIFEGNDIIKPVGKSFGSSELRKETGRILCRSYLESGQIVVADDREGGGNGGGNGMDVEVGGGGTKKFELTPGELQLGMMDYDEDKKRLEEMRDEDRIQNKYVYRSAIDTRKMNTIQFANFARSRVMDRRRRVEKKYEELIREIQIPSLSVAFSHLFGPPDVSRRLKPMRRDERAKDEGWENNVIVNIQSAINLPDRMNGKLQPFVVVSYGEKRVQTDVALGKNPNWQFTGRMKVMKNEREDEYIELRVYDQLIQELDKDERVHNVVHEHLQSRLIASTRIRFETLATASKINAPIKMKLPIYISNYRISPDSCFLKILLSTQIQPKHQNEYTQSPLTIESPKILDKCREVGEAIKIQFPNRQFRPLVVDLNANSTVCSRYLRSINPPQIMMQENPSNIQQICRLGSSIISSIPRVDIVSHTDIWSTVFQLTTIAVCGLEERATLLACWLMYYKLKVAIILGEAHGEKTGYILTEIDTKQVLIDPDDGHIYPVLDSNCSLEKIYGAFDENNYYINIQEYDQTPQLALNITKPTQWRPLFDKTDGTFDSIQPTMAQYAKVSEDWILEIRIALEREIKLRFDEARRHAIPQWNLVAARQLREVLETNTYPNKVDTLLDDKISRLKDSYNVIVYIIRIPYQSMQDCIHEVLSCRLHETPEPSSQFALAVHVVDYFAHVMQVDIALAVLKPRK